MANARKPGVWITRAFVGIVVLGMALASVSATGKHAVADDRTPTLTLPRYEVDALWPTMPNEVWMLGEVSGMAVDKEDHVWILQRPRTLKEDETQAAANPPIADCCIPAPPVLEFDGAGHFMQAWGGDNPAYEWPQSEHGIHVDDQNNVWISGNGAKDNQILKFTNSGKFLMQIGHAGKNTGSLDTLNVGKAARLTVYPKTNELFVADGYTNRRVVVFDATTGAFKRFWGAYGNKPDDSATRDRVFEGPGPQQFNTVHAVSISKDGLVYVADRVNNRIQIFKLDGTFVNEVFVARKTLYPLGVPDDVGFSADPRQQFLFVADGPNDHIWILKRDTLETLAKFGSRGRSAGRWHYLHAMAIDSKGNIYTGEGIGGRRVQKFVIKGSMPATSAR